MTTDTILGEKIERLIVALTKLKVPTVGDRAKEVEPRKVVKDVPKIEVSALSPKVEKFFKDLFDFKSEKQEEEVKKKTGFWKTLLVLLGAGLLGLYTYWTKEIWPIINGFLGLFKAGWTLLRNFFKDFSLEKLVKEIMAFFGSDGWIARLFKEDGLIGRFFKEGTFLGDLFKPIKEFFSAEGPIAKLFKEEGLIGKLFKEGTFLGDIVKTIREFFSAEGPIAKLFKEEGLIGKLFKEGTFLGDIVKTIREFFSLEGPIVKALRAGLTAIGVSFRAFFGAEGVLASTLKPLIDLLLKNPLTKQITAAVKGLAGVFNAVLVAITPLLAVFDYFDAKKDEMKRSGDATAAKMKGWIAYFANIISFGFVPFEEIKTSVDEIVDDFKSGDIVGQFLKGFLLIPEVVVKALTNAIALITGFFSDEAAKTLKSWMSEFNLARELKYIGDWLGDLVSDYVVGPAMTLYYTIKDFFVITIPAFFKGVVTKIKEVFDKIVNFDYATLIEENLPGLKQIKALFSSSKEQPQKTQPPAQPAKIAQDFVSRPGQEPIRFTREDTVLGAKVGGPIEKLLTSSVGTAKEANIKTQEALAKQISLSQETNSLLNKMLAKLDNMGTNNNIVVSNTRNNRISLGDIAGPSSFRSTVMP